MRRPVRRSAWLLGFMLLAAPPVFAQDSTEARLREALRETAAKLHATEADLAQQQLATAAAERERDALKQAPHAAKTDGAQAAALQRRLAAASEELSQARTDQQKWQAAQQASAQAAQLKETERAALAEQLSQLRARVQRCAANDDAFYGTGREIANLYCDPVFTGPVRSHHLWPFGFDRVREENRVRALEDRLADQFALAQRCRTEAASGTTAPIAPTTTAPSTPSASAAPSPSDGQAQ